LSKPLARKFVDLTIHAFRPSVPDFFEWVARYRVHELGGSNPFLSQFDFNIPQSELSHLYQHANGYNMSFPIAFCANLQQVAILSTVVRIYKDTETLSEDAIDQDYSHSTQSIDLSPHNVPLMNSVLEPSRMVDDGYPKHYRIVFSPDGKYLVVVKLASCVGAQSFRYGVWFLTIWEDIAAGANIPNFMPLAATTANSTDLLPDGTVAFHPTEPLLIVSGDIETFVWPFDPSDKRELNFSSCLFPFPC